MTAECARPGPGTEDDSFNITVGIASRLDQIRLVRAALAGVLTHLEVADQDVDSIGLAVTEIINNSIEHGYGGDQTQQVEVRLHVAGSQVQVDVIDHAPAFPPAERYRLTNDVVAIEDPSEAWSMRGHGLQIVRKIVDSITLNSENGGNCMTLRKAVALSPS